MTTVVVAGALATRPGNGGEAWVVLSWLRGLERTGYDIKFIEAVDPRFEDLAEGTAWFDEVTSSFGLAGRAALWCDGTVHGATRQEVETWLSSAALLVDLDGTLATAEAHGNGPALTSHRSLFVDLNPGYTQVWHETGLSVLGRHDFYASVGLLIGTPMCAAPDTGRAWLSAPPFVVLDDWPVVRRRCASFTTVASWTNAHGSLRCNGWKYGARQHAFRKHRCVPALAPTIDVELAIRFDQADEVDRLLLIESGFRVCNPSTVAATPDAFRRYIQHSSGEWAVADGPYVGLHTGWLSDRTVRYLASGRPAIVQDTGIGDALPVGDGLIVFKEAGEAAQALRDVASHWRHHSRAARELAVRNFAAEVVLPPLLAACEVEPALEHASVVG